MDSHGIESSYRNVIKAYLYALQARLNAIPNRPSRHNRMDQDRYIYQKLLLLAWATEGIMSVAQIALKVLTLKRILQRRTISRIIDIIVGNPMLKYVSTIVRIF